MKPSTRLNLILAPICLLVGLVATLLITRKPMEALTRENLAAAEARWAANRLDNYDMRIRMQGGDYTIRCRDRLIEAIELNGVQVSINDPGAYSVEGLHEILGMDLELFSAGRDAGVVLMRVQFDEERGFLRRYLRSGAGGSGPGGGGALMELIEFTPVEGSAVPRA
jgi:hypothetical protein